ncbi:Crp/Fnr family transcriptional regulator [Actinomadura rubrisoli]|uniref:Crp/Fnr family transcriptional regulator n=1 Tax=Actinomadura rubrisoli TaxID=2530368 RepID=A0A4R5C5L3_9ACTN|nr:Crp/Fnr family transcriptional regulator [Actinomadura rubrisoli]TDD93939.1 Crp/Fnr family transcriptional regulator [Actinomadura rubrisoli]
MANHLDPIGGWRPRSLLGGLSAITRARLLELGGLRQIAAGETIIMEGATESRDVFVLLQGTAKITSGTDSGGTVLLSIRADGDVVGELAALDGNPRLARVTTIRPCVARRIGQREFLDFLSAHPDASLAVNRIVSAKLRGATWHRVESANPAPIRVARVLMLLAHEHGEPSAEGIVIRPLTQPDIADLVSAKERTVQKALATLQRDGAIVQGYRKIIIRDREALCSAAEISEIPPEYGIG